jgi:hypothetical protein
MLSMSRVASLAVLLFASTPSSAVDCDGVDDSSIPDIIKHLDHIESVLPLVPQQQEQVITARQSEALMAGLDNRAPEAAREASAKMQENPYYHVWLARVAVKYARGAVAAILLDGNSLRASDKFFGVGFPHRFFEGEYADAEAVKLDHAGFAFYKLELMEQELSDFVHADATAPRPLLSEAVRNGLKNESYGYVGELGDYVQCKLAYVVRQRAKN